MRQLVRREHDEKLQHRKREPRFFVARVAEHFEFRSGWYKRGQVVDLLRQYYVVVRAIVRREPKLRNCLTRCTHCRILFITHPRNAGRTDLRCPFGCRQAHRNQQSTQRSAAYYRAEEGKEKKRMQNSKRRKGTKSKAAPPKKQQATSTTATTSTTAAAAKQPKAVIDYLQMMTSLIEGRQVGRDEVENLVERVLRQPSIDHEKRMDYLAQNLKKRPP